MDFGSFQVWKRGNYYARRNEEITRNDKRYYSFLSKFQYIELLNKLE